MVCLIETHNWCALLKHTIGVSHWSTQLVCVIEAHNWCALLKHTIGVSHWSTQLVCVISARKWCVSLKYANGVSLSLYCKADNHISMVKEMWLTHSQQSIHILRYSHQDIPTSPCFIQQVPSECLPGATVYSLYARKRGVCEQYLEMQVGKRNCWFGRRTCVSVRRTPHFLGPSVVLRNGVTLLLKLAAKTCDVFQLCSPQTAWEFVLTRRHGDCAKR